MRYGIAAQFSGGEGDLGTLAREWMNQEARNAGATLTIDRVDVEDLETEGDTAQPTPLAHTGTEVEWEETAEVARRLKAVVNLNQRMDRTFAQGIARRASEALTEQANARDVRVSIYEL